MKRALLLFWAALIAAIYIGIGTLAYTTVHGEKVASEAGHRARMTPGMVERGQTPPDPIPATGDFVPVTIGLYLDGIDALSIRDSFWTPTFYVWFGWKGDKALNPGGNFRLVDGRIERKELQEEF